MAFPPRQRQRRVIETPVLLSRPLDRPPGADLCLLLKGPDGAISGGYHHGRQLDAQQAQALRQAHRWQPSGGG